MGHSSEDSYMNGTTFRSLLTEQRPLGTKYAHFVQFTLGIVYDAHECVCVTLV